MRISARNRWEHVLSSVFPSELQLELRAGGLVHASAVAIGRSGVLIIGPSGSGKSSLSLELMALGAVLVSDDQVHLDVNPDCVRLSPPPSIAGQIEARGVGILRAEWTPAILQMVVDMSATENERLPVHRHVIVSNHRFPLVHNVASGHFPASILQYVKGGRAA